VVSLVQPLFADVLVSGMAVFSAGLVGYLFWLRLREKREQRRLQAERERDRRKHWGYV